MNILIYGFGRMGLTHYSILKGLNKNLSFTIIETNKVFNSILKKSLDEVILLNDKSLNQSFDITLITAPPFVHIELIQRCLNRGDKKIFIEKPFGGFSNTKYKHEYKDKQIFIGYVLRFNPCVDWFVKNIDKQDIQSISGQYLSNTLVNKPKGWRNTKYSGVLNEIGSHILDLFQYILSESDYQIVHVNKKSVISDVDDIIKVDLQTKTNISLSLYVNWVYRKTRKPVFNLNVKMKNGDLFIIDQQQINHFNENNDLKSKISVKDLSVTVPYYLRGIDFTKQMIDLTNQCNTMASVKEGININKLMNKIISHENNIG